MNAFRLAKLASKLPLREQGQVVHAALLLGYAYIAVRFMPFPRAIAVGSVTLATTDNDRDRIVREAVRSVRRASYATPFRTVCIHEGLVLQRMLRRKGAPAILCYGSSQAGGELKSHVWVKLGDDILIGGEAAPEFQLLATYPPTPH